MLVRSLRNAYIKTSRTATLSTLTSRAYHASAPRQQKDKKANLFDKDSINTDSNEYSKSAGDNTSAATADAAFSTDKTRPEEEHDAAGREAEQQGVSSVSAVISCV